MQPYRLVVVASAAAKAALAEGMLGGNAGRVLEAPATIVFAADTRPLLGVDDIVQLEARAGGRTTRYLRNLPFDAAVVTGGGCRSAALLSSAAEALLPVSPGVVPSLASPEAWAYKSTSLAAQTLLLGATAYGVSSHAMEGLYAPAVRAACGIPDRYAIPLVVSLGYERGEAGDGRASEVGSRAGGGAHAGGDVGSTDGSSDRGTEDTFYSASAQAARSWRSPRLPTRDVCRLNSFDVALEGVPQL